MYFSSKDWKLLPVLMEELQTLLSSLSDEELKILKEVAIQAEKKYSDRHLSNANHSTGTNVRG